MYLLLRGRTFAYAGKTSRTCDRRLTGIQTWAVLFPHGRTSCEVVSECDSLNATARKPWGARIRTPDGRKSRRIRAQKHRKGISGRARIATSALWHNTVSLVTPHNATPL